MSAAVRSVLTVITGKGKHSPDGNPKVLPAVREWLEESALEFIELEGYFKVYFDPMPWASH